MVSIEDSIGRKRLVALGDHVEQQAKNAAWLKYWNMTNWFSYFGDIVDQLGLVPGDAVPVNGECGTTACMLGHAVNVPLFKEAGLANRLVKKGFGYEVQFTLNGEIVVGTAELIFDLFGASAHNVAAIFTEFGYDGEEDEDGNALGLNEVTPELAVEVLRRKIAEIDAANGWTI